MGKINILPFAVANLIAAGEVVERPASVIKELMENSIDSGADRITVEIQNGGVLFMRVSDNGCGIEKDDLALAVRRHATSKIKDAGDLDGIITLGFRGEALAAIAAVSDLRIISRVRGADIGASIEVSGGDILGVAERGCSDGTTVIVENLFYNVPARRKFLKKDVTETAAVSAAVEKIALSHPEIAIRFISDGVEKINTAGDGKLLSAIYALFGREFAKGLLEIHYDYEGIGINGYIGRSDNVKPNRSGQNFFINGRYVHSKTATAAIEQAYCSYMPQERFPVCVININISPKAVDVNVHPAKLEVKFSNEKLVFEAIYYAVKNTLENNVTRPDIDPSKFSRMTYDEYKKLFSYGRATREGLESNKSTDRCVYGKSGMTSLPEDPALSEPRNNEMPKAAQKTEKSATDGAQDAETENENENKQDEIKIKCDKLTSESYINEFRTSDDNIIPDGGDDMPPDAPDAAEAQQSAAAPDLFDNRSRAAEKTEQAGAKQNISDSRPVPQEQIKQSGISVPQYKIIGEVFNSYVILDMGEKMLLVDKHAAHERIIFENLKAGMKASDVPAQILMLPLEFMLTSDEVMVLGQYKEEIEKTGFRFEAERYTVKVTSVPDSIELSAVRDIFMTIADRLKNDTGTAGLTRDIIFEKALYQASCKAAIKAGREYGPEHIKWLIEKLMEIPDITFCPHGRPVAMEISKASLDRQFGRT
jgi:DNA mismatch repair protein MutL